MLMQTTVQEELQEFFGPIVGVLCFGVFAILLGYRYIVVPLFFAKKMRLRVVAKSHELPTHDTCASYYVDTDCGGASVSARVYNSVIVGKRYRVRGHRPADSSLCGELIVCGAWQPIDAVAPAPHKLPRRTYLSLLEALCCVMASDGKLSRREKAVVCDVLAKVQAPLKSEEIEAYFADFVSRVKTLGFRVILSKAVKDLTTSAEQSTSKTMILKALIAVANADDKVHERERHVMDKFWTPLEAGSASEGT